VDRIDMGLGAALAVALLAGPVAAGVPVATEIAVLTPSDAMPGESPGFGFALAADGTTAVIGAPFDDQLGPSAGAAYVFERLPESGAWVEVIKLTASNGSAGALFGRGVAIDGDRIVVGALGVEAAYLFERDAGGPEPWGEVRTLTASDPGPNREFGFAVAVAGEAIAVGANFDGDAGTEAGAVYVFARDAGGPGLWGEVAKLTGSDPHPNARLGGRLALDGVTLAATAPGDTNAVGSAAGATYLFERDLGGLDAWGERTKLLGPAAAAVFGTAVALDGDTLVVGAEFDMVTVGSAAVFGRHQGGPDAWGELSPLAATAPGPQEHFGTSAALAGDDAVVGALFSDGPAGADTGAVHLYRRPAGGAGAWPPVVRFAASDGAPGSNFPPAVALAGGSLLAAAPGSEGRVYVFAAAVVFADGFESGDLAAWSAATP
jgi:hypothetical protein